MGGNTQENKPFRRKPVTRKTDFNAGTRALDSEDMRIMHLPRRYWTKTRDSLAEHGSLRETVEDFAAALPHSLRPQDDSDASLYLFVGSASSEVTSAAAVMLKASRSHRFSTFFLNVGRMQNLWIKGDDTADDEQTHQERAYSTDILVLDGLGREPKREFVRSELKALLSYRQSEMKVTVVTTPLSEGELEAIYDADLLGLLLQSCVHVRSLESGS